MLRASKLDVQLYEQVEADKGAMPQAMTVVVLASVLLATMRSSI